MIIFLHSFCANIHRETRPRAEKGFAWRVRFFSRSFHIRIETRRARHAEDESLFSSVPEEEWRRSRWRILCYIWAELRQRELAVAWQRALSKPPTNHLTHKTHRAASNRHSIRLAPVHDGGDWGDWGSVCDLNIEQIYAHTFPIGKEPSSEGFGESGTSDADGLGVDERRLNNSARRQSDFICPAFYASAHGNEYVREEIAYLTGRERAR